MAPAAALILSALAALPAAQPTPSPQSVSHGLRLAVIATLLSLVVFVCAALVISLRRGRRMRERRRARIHDPRDPWAVAGERAQPLPPTPDLPHSDEHRAPRRGNSPRRHPPHPPHSPHTPPDQGQ